jgi:hypothetical protein
VQTHATAHASASVPISFPTGACCNCGATAGVEQRPMLLAVTRFMLLGGTEWSVPVQVPCCATCAPSLTRRSPGVSGPVLAFAIWFGVAFVGAMSLQSMQGWEVGNSTLGLAAVVALAITGGWYGLRRPKGAQTSFYQPIRIVRLHQRFSGAITGITFGFTREDLARAFATEICAGTPRRRGRFAFVEWTPPPPRNPP